jgi:hypothetical protein
MKTSTDHFSPKGIPWVWQKLSSRIEIENEDVNENGQTVLNPVLSFDPDLGYFSPFRLDDEICKKFNLTWCYFPTAPQNDPDFHDMLNMFLEENGLYDEDRLCTYVDGSNFLTTGGNIYWLKEEAIQTILNYEHENNIRVFPRYHYKTELLEKINVLLDTHYFSGVEVEKLKQELEKENSKAYEIIAKWTYEKNINLQRCLDENGVQDTQSIFTLIDAHQKLAAEDPKVTGAFLEVLLSDPMPIGNRLHEGYCDYLWAEKDPFYDPKLLLTGKDSKADGKKFYPMPDHFPNKLEKSERIGREREKHSKMVRVVRENATKTYVQDFLVKNLVDFLEEYEERVRSNRFSYARVWNLKQSYLEGLKKAIVREFSVDALYVMKKEGKAWKMVFNGKEMNALTKIGFTYLYHLICKTNDDLSHVDLFVAAGKANVVVADYKGNYDETDNVEKNRPTVIQLIDEEGVQKVTDRIKKLKNEIDDAKEFGNMEKVHRLKEELDDTKKFFRKVYDKNKKKPRFLQDENTKKIIDSVANAIKRALDEIKKENPDAYQHFSKALKVNNLYQNSIAYRPAPNEYFDWITIG